MNLAAIVFRYWPQWGRHDIQLRLRRTLSLAALITVVAAPGVRAADQGKQTEITFQTHIFPILKRRCFSCHSGERPKAGLDLTTRRTLLEGSGNGAVVRQAAAESSLLWARIASAEMPPVGPPLTSTEKGLIRAWINAGAPGTEPGADSNEHAAALGQVSDEDRSFWSFQTPQRPPLPQSEPQHRLLNPIDSFLSRRLRERGLSFSDEADRYTLIRRLCYDLWGLPPSPEQVQRFVADTAPDAYQQLLDRLLSNPRYGERWGRHWLDLAGYADSAGILNEDRILPLAYRYRDYVIRALNSDKPYDRFLHEQLAGDELTDYWGHFETGRHLPEEVVEGVTATGFLRCAADSSRPDFANIKNAAALYFYPTLNDTLQIVSTSTLGLTLQCARCHDHMFDPIPQEDFYRVQAIFMGALRPTDWIPQMERRLKIATQSELDSAEEHNKRLDGEIKELNRQLEGLKREYQSRLFADRLTELPESLRARVREAFATPQRQRAAKQQQLVRQFRERLQPAEDQLVNLLAERYAAFKRRLEQLNRQLAEHQRRKIEHAEIRALFDLPGEVTTPFLRRGDALTPGHSVRPGVLSVLDHAVPFQWQPPNRATRSSFRRLEFARWLTDSRHPLTARVIVNRVWLHLFGEGIVATPGDFGRAGAAPSHPQLLDWLAREFVDRGWSIKRLHRLMLNSAAYRQSSRLHPAAHQQAMQVDPDNRLLWRQRIRRLEAESLRDSVFRVAGTLNERMFGPPVPIHRHASGEVTAAEGHDPFRRSIYLQVRRLTPLTMLQNFDQPNMETNCVRRSRSTVSTQALTLLNSKAMVRAAADFADRIISSSPRETIRRALWWCYSRPPQPSEFLLLEEFLRAQTERHLASWDGTSPGSRLQATAVGDPQSVADKNSSLASRDTRAQRNAVADLCHMLLSANEFIYID